MVQRSCLRCRENLHSINVVKRNGTKIVAPRSVNRPNHWARFCAVTDSRKRKICGNWVRNGRYYAQVRMTDDSGMSKPKRIPMEATDLDAAKAELQKIRTANREGELSAPGLQPSFTVAADRYLESEIHKAKKALEKSALECPRP